MPVKLEIQKETLPGDERSPKDAFFKHRGRPDEVFEEEELVKLKSITDNPDFLNSAVSVYASVMREIDIIKAGQKLEPKRIQEDLSRLSDAILNMSDYTRDKLDRELKRKIGWRVPGKLLSPEGKVFTENLPDKGLKYDSHLLDELKNIANEVSITYPSERRPRKVLIREVIRTFKFFNIDMNYGKNGKLYKFLKLIKGKTGMSYNIKGLAEEIINF